MIYLDNSATTMIYSEVLKKINDIYISENFNPSASYNKAFEVSKKIRVSRKIVADSINASEDEIFFTSGGTEGNNTILLGVARANKNKGNHIITTKIEHDSVYKTLKYLEREEGFKVTELNVDEHGFVNEKEFENAINEDTILVSIMYVNNEIGTINPIEKLAKIFKEKNPRGYFHSDIVQAYMKVPIDVKKLNVDLLTASGHKIHSIKGSGFIYVKKNTKINPLLIGGGQENNFRSGTENVAGIVSLAEAVKINRDLPNYKKITQNKEYLIDKIKKGINDVIINTPNKSAPHILNVSFLGIKSEILIHFLEKDEIYVSAGSACSAKKNTSRVIENISNNNLQKDSAIRISFSFENSKEEMDIVFEKIQKYVKEIRKIMRYKCTIE